MSDLIERLDKLITVGNAKLDAVDWEWESTIQEAITALSPVLPDDVAKQVSWLRGMDDISGCKYTADMLERQGLSQSSLSKIIAEQQERIEELETFLDDLWATETGIEIKNKIRAFSKATLQENE